MKIKVFLVQATRCPVFASQSRFILMRQSLECHRMGMPSKLRGRNLLSVLDDEKFFRNYFNRFSEKVEFMAKVRLQGQHFGKKYQKIRQTFRFNFLKTF